LWASIAKPPTPTFQRGRSAPLLSWTTRRSGFESWSGHFLDRKVKIEKWVALNAPDRRNIPDNHRQAVLDAYERIASVIDAVSELRSMKPRKLKKSITLTTRSTAELRSADVQIPLPRLLSNNAGSSPPRGVSRLNSNRRKFRLATRFSIRCEPFLSNPKASSSLD